MEEKSDPCSTLYELPGPTSREDLVLKFHLYKALS